MSLLERELLTILEHLSSPPQFLLRSFYSILFVNLSFLGSDFVDQCLSFFCSFSFDHCIVCPSFYSFRLPLWYLKLFFSCQCTINKLHARASSYTSSNRYYSFYNKYMPSCQQYNFVRLEI